MRIVPGKPSTLYLIYPAVIAAVVFAVLFALATDANAQSMTPMRGKVRSFADSFALRVTPGNPYRHRIMIEVKVYDAAFRPVRNARVIPAAATVAAKSTRQFRVIVPFEGQRERKVRICAESVPFPNQRTQLRAQVCGRFLAQRFSY